MKQQPVITFKTTEKMKKEMRQIEVNWSEYMRECVQKKINHEKRKAAFAKLDEIRKQSKPVTEEELLSWIREGRERSVSIT